MKLLIHRVDFLFQEVQIGRYWKCKVATKHIYSDLELIFANNDARRNLTWYNKLYLAVK